MLLLLLLLPLDADPIPHLVLSHRLKKVLRQTERRLGAIFVLSSLLSPNQLSALYVQDVYEDTDPAFGIEQSSIAMVTFPKWQQGETSPFESAWMAQTQ